jgi:hypothetical protein
MKHPDLVQKINDAAKNGGKEFGAANAIAEFAHFLGVIAKDADDTADKNLEIAKTNLKISEANLRLQKWIIGLTIFAIILAFISIVPVFQKMFDAVDSPRKSEKSADTLIQTNQ